MDPPKQIKQNPNVGAYHPELPKTDITQSKNYPQFGSTSARANMIGRDASL